MRMAAQHSKAVFCPGSEIIESHGRVVGGKRMGYAMQRFFLLGFLVTSVVHAGVSVEHASQVDFSQYRTFSFVGGTAATNPQLEKWLHEAVTRELRAKGLQMLAEGGDLLVRTRFEVREQQRLEVDILGEHSIPASDATKVTPGENAREIGMGTVVVELIDGHSKLTVWQGVVGAVTRTEVGKSSQKRLDKAIGRLFKKYPPR